MTAASSGSAKENGAVDTSHHMDDADPTPTPPQHTHGQYLVDRLHQHGVDVLFGVPGGAINSLYKFVKDDGRILPVLSSHESGAVLAAYGFARASGKLGAAAVTSGPGATNAVTGVATAYTDSVPIVLLSALTSVTGRNGMQDSSQFGVDTVKMFAPMTLMSAAADDPAKAVDIVERGLHAALTGRGGPVHIALSPNLPFVPLSDGEGHEKVITAMRTVDMHAVDTAAALISRGDRVAVVAGHGVEMSGAHEALRRLAEECGLAVANTPKGRVFSERHPLSIGVFGMGGHCRADTYVGEADVVLVVGTSFADTVNGYQPLKPGQKVVRIDIDPQVLDVNLTPDVSILGDARATLGLLTDALARHPRRRQTNDVAAAVALLPRDEPAPSDEGPPIHPSALVTTMGEVLPRDSIMVPDVGNMMRHITHYWVAEPGCFIAAWGFASMACALGIATGVRLARPQKPVVALVGDGAFAMNPGELRTQADHNIKVITVVFNDGGHGMVDHFDKVFFGDNASPSRFEQPIDACLVAEGFGVRGLRATTTAEFRDALKKALRHNGPCLIDATIDQHSMTPISPRFMPRSSTTRTHSGTE